MKKFIKYFLIALVSVLLIASLLFVKFDIPVEKLKGKYANQYSQFVEVEGMNVHYRLEGKGKTVVLLHGTASSLHTWDIWTDSLKQYYQVLRLDLPAFGLTGEHPKNDYSIESYTKFLHQFLQKTKIDKCYLVGNSLGGRIAWAYTLKYPSEVEKLILLDASGYPSKKARPWVFRLATTPILNKIVRYVTPRFFFENNLKQVFANDDKITDVLVQRYYELNLREGNRQAFIERAKTKYSNKVDLIKKIKCPTLIQWGEEDIWIPVEHAHQFDKDIVDSELIIYPKVGHVPMEEIPSKTVKDALLFLAK